MSMHGEQKEPREGDARPRCPSSLSLHSPPQPCTLNNPPPPTHPFPHLLPLTISLAACTPSLIPACLQPEYPSPRGRAKGGVISFPHLLPLTSRPDVEGGTQHHTEAIGGPPSKLDPRRPLVNLAAPVRLLCRPDLRPESHACMRALTPCTHVLTCGDRFLPLVEDSTPCLLILPHAPLVFERVCTT
jgi:hypothetical protein